MRAFIAVLVLIFSFQSWTKADDIRDFEIEGMSVGDSLLDYYAKDEILNAQTTAYPNSKKFYDIHLYVSSNNYDQISVTAKKNDNKYIIYGISGDKHFTDEEDKCLIKKKEIVKDFMTLLSDVKKRDYRHKYKSIDDGKSYSDVTDFKFKDGSAIRIWCNVFTIATLEKRNFFNGLSVSISPIEIYDWLTNEAYE